MKHLLSQATQVLDASGECGSIVHYAVVIALVGGAFLAFLYLWHKGKLDMDEQPKIDMMQEPPEDKGDRHEPS
jgi:hypothetical protein